MLEATRFIVIGAGGLGCPVLLALASAGARRVLLVDHDVVERSNLQRQVLYSEGDVGMRKVWAAKYQLQARFKHLDVEPLAMRLAPDGALAFLRSRPAGCVVLDCTDDPALKFAVNDAGLQLGLPVVIGAALGLQAQAMAVVRGRACYRCIYESPPAHLPTCAEAGVLGPTVGLGGAVMASLAIGLAERRAGVAGRLLAIDTSTNAVTQLEPRPRPGCLACGSASEVTDSSFHEMSPH